jgi:hypothetical protein
MVCPVTVYDPVTGFQMHSEEVRVKRKTLSFVRESWHTRVRAILFASLRHAEFALSLSVRFYGVNA